jgi:hypothetical protein
LLGLKLVEQLRFNQPLLCIPFSFSKRLLLQGFKVQNDVNKVAVFQVNTLVVLGLFVDTNVSEFLLEGESVAHLIEEEC